jgi:hypothetical protein
MKALKTFTCSTILLITIAGASFARLGETIDQSISRYGSGTPLQNDVYRFSKNGFEIDIHFAGGKADFITYNRNTRFSKAQIDQLLAVNAPEKKWKITGFQGSDPKLPATLVSEDGELVASVGLYSGSTRMSLSIGSKATEDRQREDAEAERRAKELKEIEGL